MTYPPPPCTHQIGDKLTDEEIIASLKEEIFTAVDLKRYLDDNPRLRAWEDCYLYFRKEFPNAAKAPVNSPLRNAFLEEAPYRLATFLAIFGMYRGKAYIMQNRVSIFRKLFEDILLELTWEELCCIYSGCSYDVSGKINKLIGIVISSLGLERRTKETLVSKILLGIFCLLPALDSHVLDILAKFSGVVSKKENLNLLIRITKLCYENEELYGRSNAISPKFDGLDELYPMVRTLDIMLWKGEDSCSDE